MKKHIFQKIQVLIALSSIMLISAQKNPHEHGKNPLELTNLPNNLCEIVIGYLNDWDKHKNFSDQQELQAYPDAPTFFQKRLIEKKSDWEFTGDRQKDEIIINEIMRSSHGSYLLFTSGGALRYSLCLPQIILVTGDKKRFDLSETLNKALMEFYDQNNEYTFLKKFILSELTDYTISLDQTYLVMSIIVKDYFKDKRTNLIVLLDIRDQKINAIFEMENRSENPRHQLVMSPDNRYLIVQSQGVYITLYEIDDKKRDNLELKIDNKMHDNPDVFISNALTFCDNDGIAVSFAQDVAYIDPKKKSVSYLKDNNYLVTKIEYATSHDGHYLAVTRNNKSVDLWKKNLIIDQFDHYMRNVKKNAALMQQKIAIDEPLVKKGSISSAEMQFNRDYRYLADLKPISRTGITFFQAWSAAKSDFEKQAEILHMCSELNKEADYIKLFMQLVELEQFLLQKNQITDQEAKKIIVMKINKLREKLGQPATFVFA